MSNKTSDKNVAIEKNVLGAFVLSNRIEVISQEEFEDVKKAMQNILAEREQKDKRIKELEEENMKLKAQHIFTKNKATDKEKAELYDTIDKTLDTFLEEEKPKQAVIDKIEELGISDEDINIKYVLQELLEGER